MLYDFYNNIEYELCRVIYPLLQILIFFLQYSFSVLWFIIFIHLSFGCYLTKSICLCIAGHNVGSLPEEFGVEAFGTVYFVVVVASGMIYSFGVGASGMTSFYGVGASGMISFFGVWSF